MAETKMGRPTSYSDRLADIICERLSDGQSMRTIARESDMPSMATMFNWLGKHEYFLEHYTRAKSEAADAMVEDMLSLADMEIDDPQMVNKLRLQIDTRKWIASKLKPKKYGNQIDVTSDGKALPAPIISLPSED